MYSYRHLKEKQLGSGPDLSNDHFSLQHHRLLLPLCRRRSHLPPLQDVAREENVSGARNDGRVSLLGMEP